MATSLRIIRKARAKGKATTNISTIATLARNISKKTALIRTQRNRKNKRKNTTRNN
jgi:hypothetical protein